MVSIVPPKTAVSRETDSSRIKLFPRNLNVEWGVILIRNWIVCWIWFVSVEGTLIRLLSVTPDGMRISTDRERWPS